MAVVTIYRLAEQAFNLIEGGSPAVASSISFNELKIACAQVINKMLKVEHFQVNEQMGEKIPNGSVLGLYENITPVSWVTGRSKCTLPIKPLKLPRNMGIWSIYRTNAPQDEFIPLQMGQSNLLRSQPMINDLLGQIGYEAMGALDISFTKDLPLLYPGETLSLRLAIMDINQYSDYDTLPVVPEMEWDVITEVYKMYSTQPIPDKLVDATVKEQKNIPTNQQQQP
jgi:hypothetical protein